MLQTSVNLVFNTAALLPPTSPQSKQAQAPEEELAAPPPPPVEAKVGDLVKLFMGKGQVRCVREEDGMLEVWSMGWELAGEQRARFYVQRAAVTVVPTVYYQMDREANNGSKIDGNNEITPCSVFISVLLKALLRSILLYYIFQDRSLVKRKST